MVRAKQQKRAFQVDAYLDTVAALALVHLVITKVGVIHPLAKLVDRLERVLDSSRDFLHLLLRGLLVNQLLESDVVTAQVFALLLDADHHLLSVLGRGLAGLADFVPDALEGIVDMGGNELGGGGRDVRGGGDEALGATWAARVGSAAGAESAAGVERTT